MGLKRKAETPVTSIEDITRRIEEKEKEEEDKKSKRQKTENQGTPKEEIAKEEFEFNEEDISAFGLPMEFSTKKK